MTTTTATLLPRREHAGPNPAVDALFSVPVAGGYTSDGQPAGALFLWAHGRTHDQVDYDLHRHEGLEILTIVLEGTMSHYDTETGRWAQLHAGDAQMMHSGAGISHIERSGNKTRGFQIQFDPGYQAALQQQPSYTDYPATSFTAHQVGDMLVTDLIGGSGPIQAGTEGLSVRRVALSSGAHATLKIGTDRVTLVYLIDGSATINATHAAVDDAISLHGASSMTVEAGSPTDLFVVSVPTNPSYPPRRIDMRQRRDPAGATRPRESSPESGVATRSSEPTLPRHE